MLGLPQIKPPSEVCDGCLQCKQSRSTFKQNVPIRAKEKLEVIYSDVCGPMQTESLGGNIYFISFIELTRKVWVYLIRRKSDVFEVFEKFKNMADAV